MMTFLKKTLLVISATTLSLPTAFGLYFSDVEKENKNYFSINALAQEEIVAGYEDNNFYPWKEVSRAEAVTMILNAISASNDTFDIDNVQEPSEQPFSDTELSEWYTKYINEAVQREMVDGYEDNTFQPHKTINLAELLKILVSAQEGYTSETSDEQPFADIPLNEWSTEYATYAKTHDMLYVSGSNNVDPGQNVTRGYLAEMLYRLKYNKQGYNFGKATFYGEVFHGRTTASGSKFDMNAMTAAHKTMAFGTTVEGTNLAN